MKETIILIITIGAWWAIFIYVLIEFIKMAKEDFK